ncbi:MAG: trigger factor, partial [Candidatus Aminicenantes bacterium]|nr:trigger factor [Candidatus Aminicenantes bacterium]
TVEMQGRELKTRRLLPVEKAVVLAGHAENEPALNERLAGMTQGESRSFRVSYAQDHANRRVAGKDIEYSLKVADIKEKKLPGLDDEFAKTVGEPSGLETLKDRVRKDLLASRERAVRNETASDVLAEIGRRVSLELPESLIERESLSVLRRMLSAARGRRVPPDALEGLKAEARRQAVDHITNHLIIEKIAAKEGLGVGEDEIQAEIRNLAAANGMAPAALEQMLGSEGRREELVESILFRKTVDFLVKTAIMS